MAQTLLYLKKQQGATMFYSRLPITLTFLALSPLAQSASFFEALSQGTPSLDSRLRYEYVDQKTNPKHANALTWRNRLGYQSQTFYNAWLYLDMEDIRPVFGQDHYAPETLGLPTIADPQNTELNQAYIGYTFLTDAKVQAGRQRLIIDNARFVGNVGFRQDEQTFDTVALSYQTKKYRLHAAYLNRINGISKNLDQKGDYYLAFSESSLTPNFRLGAGYYSLQASGQKTSNTWHVLAKGSFYKHNQQQLGYRLDYAQQRTAKFNTAYIQGTLFYQFKQSKIQLSFESLGSDQGQYSFQTPLATKHAFNGWADMFLTTPKVGLQDAAISIKQGFAEKWQLRVIGHRFQSDQNSKFLGVEWDAQLAFAITDTQSIGTKYANFKSKHPSLNDSQKFWFWYQLAF